MPIDIGNAPAPLTITYRPRYSLLQFVRDLAPIVFIGVTIYIEHKRQNYDWFFLAIMSFSCLAIAYSILYHLAGSSRLEFSEDTLVVREIIFGLPRWKKYDLDMVGKPYWVDKEEAGEKAKPEHLAFEYGRKGVISCYGITFQEVDEILSAVRGLYPRLGRRWDSQPPFRSKSFITLGLS